MNAPWLPGRPLSLDYGFSIISFLIPCLDKGLPSILSKASDSYGTPPWPVSGPLDSPAKGKLLLALHVTEVFPGSTIHAIIGGEEGYDNEKDHQGQGIA